MANGDAPVGNVLRNVGLALSDPRALMEQKALEQQQQRAEIEGTLEAKREVRSLIQENLQRLPQNDPRRQNFQQNLERLNQEISQLGGETQPASVGEQADPTRITPDRAQAINQSLDRVVGSLPEEAQPFLSSDLFADPVKRREEVFKVRETLQEQPNLKLRQAILPDGTEMSVFQDDRGGFRNLEGKPIDVPQDARVINASTLQGSREEIGLGDTEQRQLRDAEVSTRNFIGTVNDALGLLRENPDINTFAGRASSLVNDLQAEGQAIARSLGMDFDETSLDPSKHSETFDNLGIQNQRMRSLITSLAFQAAATSGQTGRAVSDRDIRRFIDEIGASAADPRAFAETLTDVADRSVRNLRNNFSTRLNQENFFGGNINVPENPFRVPESEEEVTPELLEFMTPEERALFQ